MSHNRKRLADGAKPKHEDVRESVEAWTREIVAKCRNYGIPAGVFLVVVPLDDPKPQWAHNLSAPGMAQLLHKLADEVAARPAGLVIAGPGDVPKS